MRVSKKSGCSDELYGSNLHNFCKTYSSTYFYHNLFRQHFQKIRSSVFKLPTGSAHNNERCCGMCDGLNPTVGSTITV